MAVTLLDRIVNGEENAFKEIFFSFYQNLLNFAFSYLQDRFVAENVVQEAFISLWENKATLSHDTNIKAFLVTVVKHRALNALEKANNRNRITQKIQDIALREITVNIHSLSVLDPEELFGSELETIIKKTIGELPPQTRQVFLMSKYEGLSHQKIARKLGITPKGVEYHISKSLRYLKVKLSDYLSVLIF